MVNFHKIRCLGKETWASIMHQSRPKAVTSTRVGTRQQTPREQVQAKDICGNRPEQAISARIDSRPQAPQEQSWVSGINGSRLEPATFVGAGPRQWPPQGQVWVSNISQSMLEAVTSTEASRKKLPLKEQGWAKELYGTGSESENSKGADLSQSSLQSQVKARVLHRSRPKPWIFVAWVSDLSWNRVKAAISTDCSFSQQHLLDQAQGSDHHRCRIEPTSSNREDLNRWPKPDHAGENYIHSSKYKGVPQAWVREL